LVGYGKDKFVSVVKHHDLKTHGGVEVHLHAFLTTVVGTDEWLDVHFSHFRVWEGLLSNHYVGAF
jgi:hypothetical protein